MNPNKRPNFLMQIIGFYMLTMLSQIAATIVVSIGYTVKNVSQIPDTTELSAKLLEYVLTNTTSILFISSIMVIVALWFMAKRKKLAFSDYVGTRPKIGMAIAILCLVAGLASNFWMSIVMNLLPLPTSLVDNYIQTSATLESGKLWLDILVIAVLAPVAEELIFRGMIYKYMTMMIPAGAAVILQGMLFGGMHNGAIWMAYATVMGCIFGYIRKTTGSVRSSILAHMAFNGGSYFFNMFAEQYWESSNITIALAVSAVLMFLTIYGIRFRTLQDKEAL